MTKTFNITWTAPASQGSSNITDHDVSYTPANGTETIVATGSALSSYTLSGLTDNEYYTVKVRAKNAIGNGQWSASVVQQAIISQGGGWDVSGAAFAQSYNPSISSPTSVKFRSDGTALYVQDAGTVKQYSMSTAYDISTATFSSSYSLTNASYQNQGFCFADSGSKLFTIFNNNGYGLRIFDYNLSTAWDVSTASLIGQYGYLPSSTGLYNVTGIDMKNDGTELYLSRGDGSNSIVYQYSLGTPYNTASGVTFAGSFSVASQDTTAEDVQLKSDDGTKMFVLGSSGDAVYEYDLSTAWDITSATYSQAFSVTAKDTSPLGLAFSSAGTEMLVCGSSSGQVHKYTL